MAANNDLKGLRIGIYARYSTDLQNPSSTDDQIRNVREKLIEARGGTFRKDLVFADAAMKGHWSDRPEFTRMVAMATKKPPELDVVAAEHTDRLGRDPAELHLLYRSLEFAGVRLITLSGVDTLAPQSHLTFALETIMASAYPKELSAKTRRGLEGRALAGYATGGLAYGYRGRRVTGDDGKQRTLIEVAPEQAKVIRRVFRMYLQGKSFSVIARILNDDRVDPPRVHVKSRRRGWKDTTIRAILHNESYIGLWKFGERRWRPVPGTRKRRPGEGKNPLSLVRPHLQIIDDDTWVAVEQRLAAVHAKYTKNADGTPKGRALPGRASSYLFSSLLACGVCGSSMVISGGGGHAQYYRCEASGKRGTCANRLSVREDVLRTNLLDELRRRLTSKEHIAYARKKATEMIAVMSRTQGTEAKERRKELTKVKAQIEKLIDFIAEGEGSPAIRDRLKALETEAAILRRQVKASEREATAPIALPTPEEMTALIFDLERRLMADVARGREELRRLFKDGMIRLNPQKGGFYVAQSEILPLVLLTTPPSVADQGGRDQVSRYSASSCAGRI